MKTPLAKAQKKARKTIARMRRDPIKWRVAEHIHEALGGRSEVLSPSACYLLASQIVDDIAPLIVANLTPEPKDD